MGSTVGVIVGALRGRGRGAGFGFGACAVGVGAGGGANSDTDNVVCVASAGTNADSPREKIYSAHTCSSSTKAKTETPRHKDGPRHLGPKKLLDMIKFGLARRESVPHVTDCER